MKKGLLICCLVIFFITGCELPSNKKIESKNNKEESIELTIGDNLPVSRALAAKMVSLAFNSKISVLHLDREINYKDTAVDKWYDKYINFVVNQNYMSSDNTNFYPEKALTLEEAQNLIDKIDPNNKLKIKMTEENKSKPISYALWCKLYKDVLQNISGNESIENYFGISEKNFTVLATSKNNSLLSDNIIITDKGPFVSEGIVNDDYIDKEIKVLEKDGEIIAVLSVNTIEPTISNAYVVNHGKNSITIFSGGAERTYEYNYSEKLKAKIVDIKIKNNKCLELIEKITVVSGKLERISNNKIELSDFRDYTIGENFKIYSESDKNIKWKQINDLIVGSNNIDFIIDNNGYAVAAIIKDKPKLNNIRVSINNNDFKGLNHNSVEISSTDKLKITGKDGIKYINPNETYLISKLENMLGGNRVFVESENNAKIEINSIKRNWPNNQSPKYRGFLEIFYNDDGTFNIVNELDFENYLYAVVPSEMPSNYGQETAKVQAITARSYAYNQYYENNFYMYGGNVDDSVMSQVYNNIPEHVISTQGVNDTKGIFLVYNDNVVNANFYSTSPGITANSGEVWPDKLTDEFPTSSKEYLTSVSDGDIKSFGDLSIEENAYKFFKDTNINTFDSWSEWFRWNTEMTAQELSASINNNLEERYKANNKLIKTLQSDGTFKSKEISNIGNLLNLEVTQRSKAGNIMEMKFIGSENTILVQTEYNIRSLLCPKKYLEDGKDIKLNLLHDKHLINYSLLPSAFFTMERMTDSNGNIEYIKFYGGGNGHGVGMSQNGAKGMADSGYDYKKILEHYYKNIDIKKYRYK